MKHFIAIVKPLGTRFKFLFVNLQSRNWFLVKARETNVSSALFLFFTARRSDEETN